MQASERERQRVEHLVLGRPRPKPDRVRSKRGRKLPPPRLHPDIEPAVRLREDWSHKQAGTPETHAHAGGVQQGALARLCRAGAISAEQLQSAESIRDVHEGIAADVTVRTASLETRVDTTRIGDGGFFERLGAVRREAAYGRWRRSIEAPNAVLDMIVEDLGYAAAAVRHRMSARRAKRVLLAALDAWPGMVGASARAIDERALAAAHARLLA